MNSIDNELLKQLEVLQNAAFDSYNIRRNGETLSRVSTKDIEIVSKKNKSGIDIIVKPNVKNKSVYVPTIITMDGFQDLAYNDFYIGKNAEVSIVAGCGIHNNENQDNKYNGVHTFHIGEGAKVKYIQKYVSMGDGSGKNELQITTKIKMKKNSFFEIETEQLQGVNSFINKTVAKLPENANLNINEKILTIQNQTATSAFDVSLLSEGSGINVVATGIAKNNSQQKFISKIKGNANAVGHVKYNGLIQDKAKIVVLPEVEANNIYAKLTNDIVVQRLQESV